ncbi:MAG: DUF456 domain-containing protein [Planctomycetota bacterium]
MLIGLPGLWLLTLSALLVNVVGSWLGAWPLGAPLVGWYAFAFILLSTLASDVMDWIAGVLGAKRAGGTRRAMAGAFAGGLVGAITGSLVVPIVGTLIGGALGAGLAATLLQRTNAEQTWRSSAKVGAGASAGWVVAVVFKLVLCTLSAVLLVVASWSAW